MSVSELRPSVPMSGKALIQRPPMPDGSAFRLAQEVGRGRVAPLPACRRSSVTWHWRPKIASDSLRDLGEYLRIGVGLGPQLVAEVVGFLQGAVSGESEPAGTTP